MAKAKAIWAIDLGQCALKALHVQMVDQQLQADAFEVIEHDQVLSQPDVDKAAAIRKALEALASRHNLRQDPVAISVPGQLSFARFTKLPPVEPKKIPDIVQFEAGQQIPFGIDEVIWDYQIFRSPDSPEVEVGIFAMKRDLIYQFLGYFREVGIEPQLVQMAPLALYNCMKYDELVGQKATILVDVGAENTDLVIAEGHRLWQRNVPLGGNNFTETLVKAFKLSFAKAEELKRTAATSKYARQVFQTMRPVFADLSAEVQRSIGFYTSINREAEMERTIALGNGFRLPGLQKFMQQNLSMTVVKIDMFNKLQLAGSINAPSFSEHVLSMATCYGLAVQALGLSAVTSTLLPIEIVRQSAWRHKNPWFVGAAACLALAAGTVWARYVWDMQAVESGRQAESNVQSTVDQYTKYKSEYNKLSQGETANRSVQIKQIENDKSVLPSLLEMIAGAIPQGQQQLAEARDPEQYKRAAEGIARSQREQVFITSLVTMYLPKISDQIVKQVGTITRAAGRQGTSRTKQMPRDMSGGMMAEMMPGDMPGMSGGERPRASRRSRQPRSSRSSRGKKDTKVIESKDVDRGFLVELKGITPHQNAPLFLVGSLVENLKSCTKERAKEENLKFWIEVIVDSLRCRQIVSPGKSSRARVAVRSDRPRRSSRRLPPSRRETSLKPERTGPVDPLTDEGIDNDSEFTLRLVAHMIGSKDK